MVVVVVVVVAVVAVVVVVIVVVVVVIKLVYVHSLNPSSQARACVGSARTPSS